ncbi:hypothetical protein Syun_000507 [Stephania yunnanensis]|uniref:Uncharacterized protein n=1 Tax=Stephania yunnanensis TaxID=152371 RepID=A0AAP0Q5E2_9MAGN
MQQEILAVRWQFEPGILCFLEGENYHAVIVLVNMSVIALPRTRLTLFNGRISDNRRAL